MCQGIRDVTNLCWKLKAVLHEGAADELLDTYSEERKLHVHTLTSRIKAIGHHICIRDPEAARQRDESLLKQGGGVAPVVTRQEIVPPLQAGLLASSASEANGTLFPQPTLLGSQGEQLMDEIAGDGWRLVLDRPDDSPRPAMQQRESSRLSSAAKECKNATASSPGGSMNAPV